MNNILIFVFSCIIFFSFQTKAKDKYYACGSSNIKISDPLIGFSKIYTDGGASSDGEWSKVTKGKVSKDTIVINSWLYTETCEGGPKCNFKWVISRLKDSNGRFREKEFASQDCKMKRYDSCDSYEKGDLIKSGYCKILEID